MIWIVPARPARSRRMRFAAKLYVSDAEVPAQCGVMALEIGWSPVRRLELPLDQEVRAFTALVLLTVCLLCKRDLEVLAARACHGNVRKRQFCHRCTNLWIVPPDECGATRRASPSCISGDGGAASTSPGCQRRGFRGREGDAHSAYTEKPGRMCRSETILVARRPHPCRTIVVPLQGVWSSRMWPPNQKPFAEGRPAQSAASSALRMRPIRGAGAAKITSLRLRFA
jgi:hypothetical protein